MKPLVIHRLHVDAQKFEPFHLLYGKDELCFDTLTDLGPHDGGGHDWALGGINGSEEIAACADPKQSGALGAVFLFTDRGEFRVI